MTLAILVVKDRWEGGALASGEGVVVRRKRIPTEAMAVRRFGEWLALITAGALALRVIVIVISSDEAVGGDGFAYWVGANQNASGHWFLGTFTDKASALHPPVWSLILTGWAALGQHDEFRQQLLAATIGTCTVGVVGLAGRRIAGDRVGLVSAAIAAVYSGLWLYERALLSETFLFLVIALIAGALGFFGVAGAAVGIAKVLFFVFLVLFVVSLVLGRRAGPTI